MMFFPPFVGYFYTMTEDYTISYCIVGIFALICAIMYASASALKIRKDNEVIQEEK